MGPRPRPRPLRSSRGRRRRSTRSHAAGSAPPGGSTAAVVLLIAVTVDLLAGDPPNRWHPVAWIGRALGWGRARLGVGTPARLLIGGALVTLGVVSLAVAASLAVTAAAAVLGWLGVLLEALALKTTLALRGLAVAARAVHDDLERADLDGARVAVGRDLVSR